MASLQHLILYIICDNKDLIFFFLNLVNNMQLRHISNGRNIGKNPAPPSGRLFGHSEKIGKIF
jgi:hypothetical protein